MLILSLDSTAQTASVGLADDGHFLVGVTLNIGNKHRRLCFLRSSLFWSRRVIVRPTWSCLLLWQAPDLLRE